MELRHVLEVVWKRWWLLVLAGIIGAALGFAASERQLPVYRATATLIVGQSIQATTLSSQDIKTSELLAQTYADLARRQPVLQGVVETLNLETPWQQLVPRVSAQPIAGTQLLEVSATAGNRERARQLADEVANQLVLLSPTALENQESEETLLFVEQQLVGLQERIETGQRKLAELETSDSTSLSVAQLRERQNEINALEGLINDWQNNYAQLLSISETRQSPNYLSVIEPAQSSSVPISPRRGLNTLLASVVAVALAVLGVLLLEYLDDTFDSMTELSGASALTPLGTVGVIDTKRCRNGLIVDCDPFSPVSDSYRMIASYLQYLPANGKTRSLLVTSSVSGEGTSTTVANLGVAMANADLKTIIVDANMRQPRQHEIFNVSNSDGLSSLIQWPNVPMANVLQNTSINHLQLLAFGKRLKNPADLLDASRMKEVVASLLTQADIVIFDCPPSATYADARVLGTVVDGVIMVVSAGTTARSTVEEGLTYLRQGQIPLLGVILNRAAARQQKRGRQEGEQKSVNHRLEVSPK